MGLLWGEKTRSLLASATLFAIFLRTFIIPPQWRKKRLMNLTKTHVINCVLIWFCFLIFLAIRLGHVRELLLPDVEEGDVLPLGDPTRPELLPQDRRHPRHPILPSQLFLQHFRSPRQAINNKTNYCYLWKTTMLLHVKALKQHGSYFFEAREMWKCDIFEMRVNRFR